MALGGFAAPTALSQTEATLSKGQRQANMTVKRAGLQRTYKLKSNAVLRDNQPGDHQILFSKSTEQAIVRSGNVMFDGHAVALYNLETAPSETSNGASSFRIL